MSDITNTEGAPQRSWLFGGNPKAIENQEAQGQRELVKSSQLPVKGSYRMTQAEVLDQYQKMGIEVLHESKDDDLFVAVKLPENWLKVATDHAMWSHLLDDRARIRGKIFYKAAFYDRNADIHFTKRINFRVDRLSFLEGDYSFENGEYVGRSTPYVGRVTDYDDTVLFETEHIPCEEAYNILEDGSKRGYTDVYIKEMNGIQELLKGKCLEFLQENYPDYEDPNKYWEL